MKILKYTSAMAVLLSLAACQSEEMQPADFLTDPNAVRIVASVSDSATRSNPTSSVSAEVTAFNDGDKIRVKTDDNQEAVYTYSESDNKWNPSEEGKFLVWNNSSHTFTAYYPSNYTGTASMWALIDQSTPEYIASADYMVATLTDAPKGTNKQITLSMQRRTARVIIDATTVNWGNQFTGYKIKSLTLSDGKTTAIRPYEADSKYYALLLPTGSGNTTADFMKITVWDGTNESTAKSLTVKGIPALEAGKSYTYTLTLGKDKATVGNVTVTNWTSKSILEEGKEDEVEEVNYTESKDANGVTTYTVYNVDGLLEVNKILTTTDGLDNAALMSLMKSNITLAADITLPEAGYGESNWMPIAFFEEDVSDKTGLYTGIFDGAGHTIRGLVINNSITAGYYGLIGVLGGTVKDVTLEGCAIGGDGYVGGIAGEISGGTIENCTVKGTSANPVSITAALGFSVGGIVAAYNNGNVIGCRVIADGGDVALHGGDGVAGGIAGCNDSGNCTFTACLVKGVEMTGDALSGGIVGDLFNSSALIGCYAYKCTTDGTLIGENNNGTVSECYYVTLDGTEVVGYNSSTASTWEQALEAMNSAITSTGWQWSGTQDNPTLTKVTSDDAQE